MKRWTPEEDLKLRELVASRPKLTAGEIAMRMDRDRNSVIGRCRRIGLALPNSGVKVNHAARSQPIEREPEPGAEPKRRRKKAAPLDGLKLGHWSDDEVAELRRLVARRPRLSAVAIADKLNREADSVRSALKKHGLSLRGNDEGKPASGPKRRRSRPQRQKSKPERQKAQQPKPKPQQQRPKTAQTEAATAKAEIATADALR